MKLEGKVALVTGAGRGIGRAVAIKLAQEGADVVCISRTQKNADSVAQEVREQGRKAIAAGIDVADSEAVDNLLSDVMKEWSRVDILVNNAGINRDSLLVRMKDEDWDSVLDTNLKGAFICARAAAKVMMKQRYGRIVNVTSIVGLSGNAGQVNYSASKAGLIGLTKSIARELGSRNITCNAIAPGFIETDMTAELNEEMRKKIVQNTSVGRLGTPEDIAGAVLFLCSDESSFISGQVISVDGGLSF
ncbi:MAG: 3-oxoacyl-[acyl-carrier-protein] reductase [bacterium]|jgi:3-oxoacyl-[acyl-carrier protein] reductase